MQYQSPLQLYAMDCLGLSHMVEEPAMVGVTYVPRRPRDCFEPTLRGNLNLRIGAVQHALEADAMDKQQTCRAFTEAQAVAVGNQNAVQDEDLLGESHTTVAKLQQQVKAMQSQLAEMQMQLDIVKVDALQWRQQHDKALEPNGCWQDYSVIFLAALVSVCYWLRLI